jgi:indolepyruvate ferredoxin oxidoreductase beta subunit
MKKNIILSGVGGQGILSIATIIGEAATEAGLYLKQAEVHGMSQRGGDVQSNLRLSTEPIYSDLIPQGEADIIIAMEPMEALRYVPFPESRRLGHHLVGAAGEHPQLSRRAHPARRPEGAAPREDTQHRHAGP